jgi:hypothetical protein
MKTSRGVARSVYERGPASCARHTRGADRRHRTGDFGTARAWPRRTLPAAVLALAVLTLVACAGSTLPRVDTTRTPEQAVAAFGAAKLSARGDPDVLFGIADLRALARPMFDRCRVDGGDLVVLGRSEVRFAAKVNSLGLQQAQLVLPTRVACRASTAFVWGADLAYRETKFFPSQWAEQMYYYADLRTNFISGSSLEATEPTSMTSRESARQRSDDCSAKRAAYTQRLRTEPRVGMEPAFGTIIEVRPPLVLIQYSALGRQIKGRDDEWVQISGLSSGANCPS